MVMCYDINLPTLSSHLDAPQMYTLSKLARVILGAPPDIQNFRACPSVEIKKSISRFSKFSVDDISELRGDHPATYPPTIGTQTVWKGGCHHSMRAPACAGSERALAG